MAVLSAGGMRFMQSWKDVGLEEIQSTEQQLLEQIVARAFAVGINHIETARVYGTSERQLGEVLKKYSRASYILQTKVAPTADPLIFTDNVLDSLNRLQVERVDLLGLHGINTYEQLWWACKPGGCLAAARKLQQQGKVGWVGFSSHGSTELLLQAVGHAEERGFDYLNLHWYTIFQRHQPVLAAAAERDMGVFIISPSDKGGMLHTPPALLTRLSEPLSPMQFNDLFCLHQPAIHTLSIGAAQPGDFDEHVRALEWIDDIALVHGIYLRWQERMKAICGCDRPDIDWERYPCYRQTPGMINIPFIAWLYNLARGWDLLDYARARYAKLSTGSDWVAGNNGALVDGFNLTDTLNAHGGRAEHTLELLREAHRLLQEPAPDTEQ